ncbi:MAG: extracellular solute-binding protein [Paracoccaceae bacterium]
MSFAYKLGTSAIAFAVTAGMAHAQDAAAFWAEAAKPYEGTVLHGVTESTPPSNYIKDVLAPQFEELTGIRVDIETTSWDQMYDKAIKDMEAGTGIYDMVYIEQDIVYAYLSRDFLTDTTQLLVDNPALKSPNYDEGHFTSFAESFRGDNGNLFGIPVEAFIKTYLYRTDLFNDPAHQAAYKEKTGKDLAPATTHEDYLAIAEYFTEWGQANGGELWGTTSQSHTGHPASWYEYVETVLPTFGIYNWGIDAGNNYAAKVENGGKMDSPEAKAAMKYALQLRDLAPPESVQSTWTETATTMAAGRAAQGMIYGENTAWIASDENQSRVVGNIGVALPPLSEGVLAQAEAGEGYVGYYDGGAFGIPITSKNKEAAMLFLEFIAQDEVQPDWAVAGSRITNNATYDDPKVQELDGKLNGYFTMLKDDGRLYAGAPPYPFHAQLREALAPIYYQILTGQIDPDTGVDQMAQKAEDELSALGYRQ